MKTAFGRSLRRRTKVILNKDLRGARIYDAQTGQERQPLSGTGLIGNFLFSPDSKTIATTNGFTINGSDRLWPARPKTESNNPTAPGLNDNKSIRLWDVQTGKLKQTLTGEGGIYEMRFSPDGKKVIALTMPEDERFREPTIVQVWDVKTGQVIQTIKEANSSNAVAISPDGLVTVSIDEKGGLNVRETLTGVVRWTRPGLLGGNPNEKGFLSFAFSPDGKTLAAQASVNFCPFEFATKLWNTQTGQALQMPKDFKGEISFAPDTKTLIGHTSRGNTFWDMASGTPKWSLPADIALLGLQCRTSDCKLAVGRRDNGALVIHDAQTRQLLVTLMTFFNQYSTAARPDWIAFTPEGYYAASPGAARHIRWRVGDKLLPAESYAKEFNRPDLVQQAMQTK